MLSHDSRIALAVRTREFPVFDFRYGAAGLALLALAFQPARAEVLYDSGSIIGGGRSVSAIFAVVQPLVVPEPGWHVTSIGTDGLVLGGLGSPGVRCDVFRTSIGGPDGGAPVASCTIELPASGTGWSSAPIDASMPAGQYFVRWTHNGDATYVAMIRRGTSGEASFSWRRDTGGMIISDPTALRVEGALLSSCPADLDDDGNAGNGGNGDGAVTIDDLLYFLGAFEAGMSGADVDDGSSTGTHDGAVTIDDLLFFVFHFEAGC